MATLNLRRIPEELYRKLKVGAASAGMGLRDYAVNILEGGGSREPDGLQSNKGYETPGAAHPVNTREQSPPPIDLPPIKLEPRPHNSSTCQLYGCGMCKAMGYKNPKRGI